MRILVLNQYFYPDRSATSQLLTEMCEDLAKSHDVFVVTGRPSYNAVAETASRGLVSRERHGRVKVGRVWSTGFDRSNMPGRLTNYLTYVVASFFGAGAVKRPDVVVALTDPPPIGLVGLLTARARRRPFVLVVKDIFPDVAIQLGVLSHPVVIALLRTIQRTLFSGADRLVSIGRDMDRRLGELGVDARRIVTIRDWADGTLIQPPGGPSIFRRERGWEDRFVVMHSGNVGLSQDLDTVIEAADRLRNDPRILFAIVGEGASKGRLQRRAGELGLTNVEFLPYQDKTNLGESLGAADLHLIGLKEGVTGYIVPSKLYGILAAGRPYLAAIEDWAEPALIAVEHGCGVRVDPGDPAALAEAIRRLSTERKLGEMGRRGRRTLEEEFDRSIAAMAYERLLDQVVAEAAATALMR